ncbi:MAG: LytTR family transcriptional regulator DNA-binding domain-containing protein [archaeon]
MNYNIQKEETILLKNENQVKQIYIENISFIKCEGYLSILYLIDHSQIRCSKLLKDFESELQVYYFYRINHNTIINLRYFDNIIYGERKRTIALKGGHKFRVSRRKWSIIKKKLGL